MAIARVLVNNPVMILADKATGNLDTKTSYEIMSLFQELNTKEGKTIVFVTHEPDIAVSTNGQSINTSLNWPIVVSQSSVILYFVVCVVTGVFFGYYPALKASKLDPIEVLRYE